MKKKYLVVLALLLGNLNIQAQTITDIDGNVYHTITIGSQTWTKENLKNIHFSNGDLIPTTTLAVYNDSSSIYQWAYNHDSTFISTYGRLYSWYAAKDVRNVCPSGWHVPTLDEWEALSIYLGGDSIAGSKMKDTGTTYWLSTDTTVNNQSEFTGLPGGFRGNSNVFTGLYSSGLFWSSTPFGNNTFQRGYAYHLQAQYRSLSSTVAVAQSGLSVRCIKSAVTNIDEQSSIDLLNIYPNPFQNVVMVDNHRGLQGKISVYSLMGSLVLQKCLEAGINRIELGYLLRGVYVVKVGGGGWNKVVIKE